MRRVARGGKENRLVESEVEETECGMGGRSEVEEVE